MTNKTTITLTLAIASILIASPFAIPSSNADLDLGIAFDPEGPVEGPVMYPSIFLIGDIQDAIISLETPDGPFQAVCGDINGDAENLFIEIECIVHVEFTSPGPYCWQGSVITFDGQELPIFECAFDIQPQPPRVQLTKTCEVRDGIAPGQIAWLFQYGNTGDTDWTGTLDDPQLEALLGNPGLFPLDVPLLGPGQNRSTEIITGGLDAGTYTNQAIIDVVNEFGLPNSDTSEEVSCTILPNQIDVDIDIKPGSFPNSINTKSMGLVPVAILGSAEFDVTLVDVSTLSFGPGGAIPKHDLTDPEVYVKHLQDVNDDGFLDLVSHYVQKELGLCVDATGLAISGELLDGTPFEGTDSVRPLHAPDC